MERKIRIVFFAAVFFLLVFPSHLIRADSLSFDINDLASFCSHWLEPAMWAWQRGAQFPNMYGYYGVKGVTDVRNILGARMDVAGKWVDSENNIWLFGGTGYAASGGAGYLNDLWKFDGTNWTWMSGSNSTNQSGSYGVKGVPSPSNIPGARGSSYCWQDSSGNFWLFGGGFYFNDLWKFDGTNWTWMGGSSSTNQSGSYGIKGVAAPSNIPGARCCGAYWTDSYGNFWLFGGLGYGGSGTSGCLNDLWKFDGTNWTWVSGSQIVDQFGTYGTKGLTWPSNCPGGRYGMQGWVDDSGNVYIFGGAGYAAAGSLGELNDLWKFDGTNWTWIGGANVTNQSGVYGIKGVPSSGNYPGARHAYASWTDAAGNFWLFGGAGYSASVRGFLNDLWRFDGTNWTWIGGSDSVNQYGVYGYLRVPAVGNYPGSREGGIGITDLNGRFWLFGGWGYASSSTGYLSELWRYSLSGWDYNSDAVVNWSDFVLFAQHWLDE